MQYKYRYVCNKCLTPQNYKVSMDKRYKCKACGCRTSKKYSYDDLPKVGVFVNFFCPTCNQFQDFYCDEHFKTCKCGYSRARIEYQYCEEIG